MQNFEYYAPTKVVFGKGAENKAGEMIKALGYKKAMVVYGGKSAEKSGLLDRIYASLNEAGVSYVPFGGAQPNPRLSKALEGIAVAKENGVDFLLAVGGGSVIDTAKCIGYGMTNEGDVWEFYDKRRQATACMPLGAVLTMAAAGSEMSNSSVITNEDGWLKKGYSNDLSRCKFALMNPELTYTLPAYQTASGIVDILFHTMERYFTTEDGTELTDSIAEGLLRSVMHSAKVLVNDPENYEARANVMWASSLSHNGLTGCGTVGDWACHQLEHELSGMFDVAHGAGLAAMFSSWARYVYTVKPERFAQFAVNVLGVNNTFADPKKTAEEGIAAMEDFYHSIGMPANIRELGYELNDAQIDELAVKCTYFGRRTIGGFKKLELDDIREIYRSAAGVSNK